MKGFKVFAVIAVALALTAGTAFAENVKVMSKGGVGDYLADAEGMTLYYFKNDSSGKSTCYGKCVRNWPIYYVDGVEVPEGLDAKDFGTITRDDGKKQTTFRGYPLYYFISDGSPGDTKGEGIGDVWYVVNPAKFMKKMKSGY